MKLKFISPSDQELIDTYNYYEDKLIGLGDRFLHELNQTLEIILDHPKIWDKVGRRTRKALLKQFPYFILYVIEKDTILITCIAHQHRNPDYYFERID
jgi:hypothetical protein